MKPGRRNRRHGTCAAPEPDYLPLTDAECEGLSYDIDGLNVPTAERLARACREHQITPKVAHACLAHGRSLRGLGPRGSFDGEEDREFMHRVNWSMPVFNQRPPAGSDQYACCAEDAGSPRAEESRQKSAGQKRKPSTPKAPKRIWAPIPETVFPEIARRLQAGEGWHAVAKSLKSTVLRLRPLYLDWRRSQPNPGDLPREANREAIRARLQERGRTLSKARVLTEADFERTAGMLAGGHGWASISRALKVKLIRARDGYAAWRLQQPDPSAYPEKINEAAWRARVSESKRGKPIRRQKANPQEAQA